MKNTKIKIILFIFLAVSLLFFSNNEGLVDIEKTAIIKAVGIDYIDGEYVGSRIMAPDRFSLPTGKHRIEIEVANTYANALEAYKAPAGLVKTPYITEG